MKVTVELLAQARAATCSGPFELDVAPSGTLAATLAPLQNQLEDGLRQALFSDEQTIRPSVMLLVNGEVVHDRMARRLADGDTITMLTPIGGG